MASLIRGRRVDLRSRPEGRCAFGNGILETGDFEEGRGGARPSAPSGPHLQPFGRQNPDQGRHPEGAPRHAIDHVWREPNVIDCVSGSAFRMSALVWVLPSEWL